MPQSPNTRPGRIRVSRACENCREKKSKCDGVKPACGRCQLKSLNCYYDVTSRVKNQQLIRELATRVARYESALNKSISPYQKLQKEATTDPTLSNSEATFPQLGANVSDTSPNTSSHPDMNLDTFFGEQSSVYNPSLPSRALLEQGIEAFSEGTAVLFTFFDEEEISSLFDDIYLHQNVSRFRAALPQLCGAAAIGCRYFPHRFDDGTHTLFVSITKESIEEIIEDAPLSAIRVLALLAMYFTFEKRTAALMYVDMGLRLAKLYRHQTMINEQPLATWQRVFGSLVFLDCWLCSMIGHLPSSQNSGMYLPLIIQGTTDALISTVVQFEMVKIAILNASILQDVYHTRFVSSVTIDSYRNRLRQWLAALPDYMRLDRLLVVDEHQAYLRPIMLLHLLYMNTVILVYRRILMDVAALGRQSSDPEVFQGSQLFLEPCIWTARQVSKLLEIALSQKQVLPTCWMTINATYSTCNLLLYSIASRLMDSNLSEQADQDMVAAKQCIKILAFCADVDEFASQYLTAATALSDNIAQIMVALVSKGPTTFNESPPAEINNQLLRLMSLASRYLIHPFDGGFRRELSDTHGTLKGLDSEQTQTDSMYPFVSDSKALVSSPEELPQEGQNIFWSDLMHHRGFVDELQDSTNGKGKGKDQSLRRLSFTFQNAVIFGT